MSYRIVALDRMNGQIETAAFCRVGVLAHRLLPREINAVGEYTLQNAAVSICPFMRSNATIR